MRITHNNCCGRFGSQRFDFCQSVPGHDHSRRCAARLTHIAERGHHAGRHGFGEVGVGQEDIRRFAAQFLSHSFNRRRGGLRHQCACPVGAGDRDHVDIRVGRHRTTDLGAAAIDQIEYPRRQTRVMHQLCEQQGAQGRQFAGLEHHGAAGRDGRGDLGGDLIQRPVPRRDQPAHTDGLAFDRRAAFDGVEAVSRQQVTCDTHVFCGQRHLHGPRRTDGCAHLQRDRLRQLFLALENQLVDPADDLGAGVWRGAGPAGKGCPRCRNCTVDIGGRATGDMRHHFFGRWVDHRDTDRVERGGPTTIDIQFQRGVRINVMAVQGL